jgi:FMN-dependent NADH-azoreductase
MTRILYIAASPRAEMSQSGKLAEAYLAARQAAEPNLTIDRLDLWRADLPEFDGDKAAAKMTFFGVGEMDATRQSAWDQIVAITQRFTDADEYVLAVPMWNGGVPYKLKHYIDIITQPGLLFGFDPDKGYFGLLEGKSARVFFTSGVYAPGAPAKYGMDFHSTYLNWWLDFIGVTEVKALRFQPSLLTPDQVGDQARAVEKAKGLAPQPA